MSSHVQFDDVLCLRGIKSLPISHVSVIQSTATLLLQTCHEYVFF